MAGFFQGGDASVIPSGAFQSGITIGGAGPFAGTSAVVAALSTLGDVASVRSSTLVLLNGTSQKLDLATTNKVRLGSKVSRAGDSDSELQEDIIEDLKEGMTLEVFPRYVPPHRLLLSMDFSISQILYPKIGSQREEVERLLTSVDERKFTTQAMVPLGSRFIFSAYNDADVTASNSGVGSPFNWLFGGSRNSSQRNTSIVISVRPVQLHPQSLPPRERAP